jgi:phosphoribosylglycinamide formyltransferase 1
MKLGWFTSGGESSYILFEKTYNYLKENIPDVSIEFVFCDKSPGESEKSDRFINYVKSLNIPLITLSWKKYKETFKSSDVRRVYFLTVRKEIESLNLPVDYIFYIGFMLITTPEIHNTWECINLHPALPNGPAGTWKQVIKELLKDNSSGLVKSGAMMHRVTDKLDDGKVIAYFSFSCTADHDTVRKFGFHGEFPLIIETIKILNVDSTIDVTDNIKNYYRVCNV